MIFAPPDYNADSLTGHGSTTSRPSKPGKTAPRLLHDATLLDVHHASRYFDILSDPAPFHYPGKDHAPARPAQACDHNYALNLSRTKVPVKDYRPAAGDEFWLQAVCRKCRAHIHIDLKYSASGRRPCPNHDYPLHHFIRQRASTGVEYAFQCSSPDCGAVVNFRYSPRHISDEDIDLIADPTRLRKRYDAAIEQHGIHRGFILPTEVSTLWKLRRYVRDSLKPDGIDKRVPLENKRYLESFANDCDEIFERLGFRKEIEDDDAVWALPKTNPEGMDSHRIFLENWDMELQVLIDQHVTKLGELHPCADYVWYDALPEMSRLLSIQSYSKSESTRNEVNPNSQDHPYYASLGAMRDFADELIIFAYERQVDCDPQNGPYYFDCLQDLARGRTSETLVMKTSFLEGQGVVGKKAVEEAFAYFSIDLKSNLTDQMIVDRYRSRMEDTASSQQPHAREMLKRIGTVRQSRLLIDAASDTIETYEQALSWIGADKSYPDESILTLFTTKTADSPESERLARKAVQIIADARNSDPLRSWLSTGEMRDSGMSVDDACAHLKISLTNVDEQMLQLVYDNARSDNPGWKTEQAIETVIKAYKKPEEGPKHDPANWPVGLTSHGNTCYLNSLLQYYFTIKPLRDLVLDFDQHKHDLSKGGKIDRVGARKVTTLEIRAYQKFVGDLRHLFERMIRDRGPAVKPEADLVCRAFLKAEDTETQTATPSRAGSPPADVGIEQPPEKPPRPQSAQMEDAPPTMPPRPPKLVDEASVVSAKTLGSDDSSVTLGDDQADREAFVKQSKDVEMKGTNPVTINPPTPPDSPTLPSSIHDSKALDVPPLPPRPSSTPVRQQTNLAKAEEAARQQQDVTEVMDEILFRLRCAITSEGMDPQEEQLDAFRKIFYMRTSEKTLGESGKVISREDSAQNILLNIPSHPTDIYAALDEVFELQTIDHGSKKLKQYKTLQTLPPILQINIPRNTYDRTTGRGVKVEHKVHLEETLYVDRYFEWEDTKVTDRRKATWEWRQRLDQLQAQKDLINRNTLKADSNTSTDGPTGLQATAHFIRAVVKNNEVLTSMGLPIVDVDESMARDLEVIADAQRVQLDTIEEEMTALQTRISTSFEDLKEIKYRLFAVFFHRGGYGHGHYWTCIRDFQNNIWRQYNDEKVEEFTKLDDIFDASTWQQGTPTYAVYVKDDEDMPSLVQPVCRDPEELIVPNTEANEGPVDEVMQDAPPAPNYPPPKPQPDGHSQIEDNNMKTEVHQ
ncbi:Ubiquitin carboxyl-terminal hydrolase-like protein 8 [Elsinoe fawcettii]|nr:Ubiquitin carboxyl-terminal hydrolase-like protein 8 [Elsinoe fawcettii]